MASTAAPSQKIRVAIIGGGIAGATLLQSLLRIGNLDVHLFERALEFRESGFGIGIGESGVTALEILGLRDRLDAAKAVFTHGARAYVAQGRDTGELAVDVEPNKTWGVLRSNLLHELLVGVDADRLHTGKKLINIAENEDIVLTFEDGTTHACDVLFGADGIYSTIRKYVLGSEEAAATTRSGWRAVWVEVPYEEALKALGPELANKDAPTQFAWCSERTWIMHSLNFDTQRCSCILSRSISEEETDLDLASTNKAQLLDWVSHFDHPVGKAVVGLMTKDRQDFSTSPGQHHYPPTKKYVKGRVAIVGDAASASTPWRGSACSIAIEDALIISSCFAKVTGRASAEAALKAYERMQEPRRSRLVIESHRAGVIMSGEDKDIGLNAVKMRDTLGDSWKWIHEVDLNAQVKKALEMMENEIHSEHVH